MEWILCVTRSNPLVQCERMLLFTCVSTLCSRSTMVDANAPLSSAKRPRAIADSSELRSGKLRRSEFLSPQTVLDLIKKERRSDSICSNPHQLDEAARAIPLIGREAALEAAVSCCQGMINALGSNGVGTIPVCCGISGLGKTRLLEEVAGKLKSTADLDSVIVNFDAESSAKINLSVEAEFAWRLAYHVFLKGNSAASNFGEWFIKEKPTEADKLKLSDVVSIIAEETNCQLLFVGVDSIENIRSSIPSDSTPFTTLVASIRGVMEGLISKSSSLRLVPMLAGGSDSFKDAIKNTSVTLLSLPYWDEKETSCLLQHFGVFHRLEMVHRHLFFIDRIPGHIVDYLTSVENQRLIDQPDNPIPGTKMVAEVFEEVRKRCVCCYNNVGTLSERVRVAAFAVSESLVTDEGVVRNEMEWPKMEKLSWCRLVAAGSGSLGYKVQIPYLLLINVAMHRRSFSPDTLERAFADAVWSLYFDVDLNCSAKLDWSNWEAVGAYHYAIRINSILLTEGPKSSISRIWNGALIDSSIQSLQVILVPVQVVQSCEKLGRDAPETVGEQGNRFQQINWRVGSHIVLNGVGGQGLDIIFTLHVTSNCSDGTLSHDQCQFILIVDQRKLIHSKKGKVYINTVLAEAINSGPRGFDVSIGVLMASSAPVNLKLNDIPAKGIVVARQQIPAFYGMFTMHPAVGYTIAINDVNASTLQTLFSGNRIRVSELINEIMSRRNNINSVFESIDELTACIDGINARHNNNNNQPQKTAHKSNIKMADWVPSAVRFTS